MEVARSGTEGTALFTAAAAGVEPDRLFLRAGIARIGRLQEPLRGIFPQIGRALGGGIVARPLQVAGPQLILGDLEAVAAVSQRLQERDGAVALRVLLVLQRLLIGVVAPRAVLAVAGDAERGQVAAGQQDQRRGERANPQPPACPALGISRCGRQRKSGPRAAGRRESRGSNTRPDSSAPRRRSWSGQSPPC